MRPMQKDCNFLRRYVMNFRVVVQLLQVCLDLIVNIVILI